MQKHEEIWERKIDLQQQEIDNIKNEYLIIRRESEGMRKMFVELLGRITSLTNAQNSTPNNAFNLDNSSGVFTEQIEFLKKENKFLKEKIEAQEEIITRLSEELENY